MAKLIPWTVERILKRTEPGPGGCLLWTGAVTYKGYGKIRNHPGLTPRFLRAHRLMFELHHGNEIGPGLCVLHSCDVRHCVNPDHLRVGTNAENVADRVRRRRTKRGSQHGRAKLDEQKVVAARIAYHVEGVSISALARRYKVDRKTMRRVLNRETWTHV